MSQTSSVWMVLAAALAAANLPFLNERILGLLPGGMMTLCDQAILALWH